jgi:diacylglycerol kinase
LKKGGACTRLRSFKFAFQGIVEAIRTEHNFRFMLAFFMFVVAAGVVFEISRYEWLAVLICCGLVLGMEIINMAVEAAVDIAAKSHDPLAKKAKDAAAGASLVVCAFSAAVGLIVFVPYIIALFSPK